MKPYRGTLLATAMLLATLQPFGCGRADDWEKTTEIRLSAPTPKGINEVVFTVISPPPAEGYACDTILQYRAEGAGVNINWTNVPGTETTRVFGIRPNSEGVMSVIARGKCDGAKEDWKYSNQVDVTVTALAKPTVTSVSLSANPTTVVKNNAVTFTLGATKAEGCTLRLKYQYTGAGFAGIWTVDPASPGLFQLTPTVAGPLVVTATGWCTQNPTVQTTATATVTVTDTPTVTITTPSAPTFGAPVNATVSESFSSGGSTCSNGETVQYQFTATGSPTTTNPVPWSSSASASFTWGSAGGPHTVSVQARCAISTGVVSSSVSSAAITVL